jgi:hypothetical protein
VFALVAIHVAAFAFWCWLLWSSRKRQQGNGGSSSGSGGMSGSGIASRSTKDILRAYHKSSLGKG